jgi:hypothetical protein
MRGDSFSLGGCRAACGDCEVCGESDIGEATGPGKKAGLRCLATLAALARSSAYSSACCRPVFAELVGSRWRPLHAALLAACKSRNRVRAGYLSMEEIA